MLSIIFNWSGTLKYRLIGDDGKIPALHDARQFEVSSSIIPSSWIIVADAKRGFQITPKSWSRIGFWEEYFDGDLSAVETFETEKKVILSVDAI